MAVVACGCSSNSEPSAGETVKPRVVVLGDNSGTVALIKAGCAIRNAVRPEAGDLVLVAVSCRQGVEGKTLDALDEAAGASARRLAILLTEADAHTDKDLLELVEMESKLVLSGAVGGDKVAEKLAVLRADDRNLGDSIKALIMRKAEPIQLAKPNRREWEAYIAKFKK
jgi:hypothetical protein